MEKNRRHYDTDRLEVDPPDDGDTPEHVHAGAEGPGPEREPFRAATAGQHMNPDR
jgi:hypothetical protein